ncbi:MAG: GNAT family N-acetyltransferase [Chthoniobacterales bacterium]|nr:GNAT family N-acetyltransferase [Chthoniobacterales bacterium]MBA3884052.1 GNAT family N-acetyltransferase [Chthoniobacterales bacterium]
MKADQRFDVRVATVVDIPCIEQLIVVSARKLSRGYYDDQQIEAAIAHIFGVDTTLISDGTYFVAETENRIVGCGGWSQRRKLFGGDQYAARDAPFSEPCMDPARIRAFFVHPGAARTGVGCVLLARCENEARARGHRSAELMSTLPGVDFYRACGYEAEPARTFTIGEKVAINFVPMRKTL